MWRALIKLIVSALLIFLLLRSRNLHALLDQIIAVDRSALTLATLCYAALAVPSTLRWSIVIAAMGHRLGFGKILAIVLIGYFFNLTLISSIGGDAIRMWKAYRAGLPSDVAVSSVVIERLAQLLAHLLIVAASAPILFYQIPDATVRIGLISLLCLGAAGFGTLMIMDRLPESLQKFRILGASAQLAKDIRRVLLVSNTAVPTVLLGFVNQITIVLVLTVLAAGLNLPIGFADCLIVVPAAMLLTAIPISIGGWGVREGAFVVGFSYVGLSSADALALSVLFGLLNTAVRLPGALVWLLMPDKRAPRKPSKQFI
jgi:glycosyltransferase 2 family protein